MKASSARLGVLAASAGLLLTLAQASAQDKPVTLKFADWLPLTHFGVPQGSKFLMEKATALSKDSVKFEYFPSEQLGKAKDALMLVQTGVADIANIPAAYISDKLPMTSVAELPMMYPTACAGADAFLSISTGDGIMAKAEFNPQKIHVLAAAVQDPYRVMTVKKPVDKASDFKGIKLRTGSGSMDITAEALGAVPVRIPGGDTLASMSRGTVDGAFWTSLGVKSFDLQTAAKHVTTDVNLGGFVFVYAISDRAWQSLSTAQKAALTEAGKLTTLNACDFVAKNEKAALAELETLGMKGNTMAPGELAKIQDQMKDVYKTWAKKLDDIGKPGSAVLAAFTDAVAKTQK